MRGAAGGPRENLWSSRDAAAEWTQGRSRRRALSCRALLRQARAGRAAIICLRGYRRHRAVGRTAPLRLSSSSPMAVKAEAVGAGFELLQCPGRLRLPPKHVMHRVQCWLGCLCLAPVTAVSRLTARVAAYGPPPARRAGSSSRPWPASSAGQRCSVPGPRLRAGARGTDRGGSVRRVDRTAGPRSPVCPAARPERATARTRCWRGSRDWAAGSRARSDVPRRP